MWNVFLTEIENREYATPLPPGYLYSEVDIMHEYGPFKLDSKLRFGSTQKKQNKTKQNKQTNKQTNKTVNKDFEKKKKNIP